MEERMSMTQTMLGEKLQKRGFIPREVEFSAAISKFLNNGGTLQRAYDLLSVAADRMGAGGQTVRAGKANSRVPPASLPHGDEGHAHDADRAKTGMSSSPQNDSAAGQRVLANGQTTSARPLSPSPSGSGHRRYAPSHPGPAAPAREPSKADISAMIAARKESAVAVLTIFDRYKVRDGRALKKLRFHELMKLAQEDEGEARAFRYMVAEVESKVANPDRMARVTDLVSAELAEKAFAFAKVASNA
jgi:hypothetical protein